MISVLLRRGERYVEERPGEDREDMAIPKSKREASEETNLPIP
jgi:hypothetical protein